MEKACALSNAQKNNLTVWPLINVNKPLWIFVISPAKTVAAVVLSVAVSPPAVDLIVMRLLELILKMQGTEFAALLFVPDLVAVETGYMLLLPDPWTWLWVPWLRHKPSEPPLSLWPTAAPLETWERVGERQKEKWVMNVMVNSFLQVILLEHHKWEEWEDFKSSVGSQNTQFMEIIMSEGTIHNSVIIYTPSCYFITVLLPFFCLTQKCW